MIPVRLQFSGIRDFKPTLISLGNTVHEHVLITGPNGVGKSTISFCIGAILYSSKIDLEGLRSNNLPYDQKWQAHLALTFKNEGPSKIDAPLYISFHLVIEQAENRGVIQREYQVWMGDEIDALTLKDVYRSGDSQHRNFTMYKEDLQYKYKIDSDLFYLIWYQQEVNQFAEMSPPERFRRFSEMHHIDEIQRSWESAIEHLKELEAELNTAKSIVKQADFNLKIAQQEYDRLKDNQKRLMSFGKSHIVNVLTLIEKYTQQYQQAKQLLAEKEVALQEAKGKLERISWELSENEISLQQQETVIREHHETQQQTVARQKTLQSEKLSLAGEITVLKDELAETEELRRRLRYAEPETQQKAALANAQLQNIQLALSSISEALQTQNQNKEEITDRLVDLQQELKRLEQEEQQAKELLQQYTSAQHIHTRIAKLQKDMRDYYSQKANYDRQLEALSSQLTYLNNNQLLSERQKEGLRALQAGKIEAFALRDLVTLEATASLKDEQRLNTIKYAIFYNAPSITPINDLYYVSLQKLVPNQLILAIPALKLKIRDNLSEVKQNYAVKVLWWIQQFFQGESPTIRQGILEDRQGLRGSQEKNTYILNEQAVAEQRQRVQQKKQQLAEAEHQLTKTFEQNQAEVETLYGVLKEVQAAEAKMLEADRKDMKMQYVDDLLQQKSQIAAQITANQKDQEQSQLEYSKVSYELERLQEELAIYDQLGTVKALQNSLVTKNQQLSQVTNDLNSTELAIAQLQQKASELASQRQETIEQQRKLTRDQQDTEYEIQAIEKMITKTTDEIETLDASILQYQLKREELQEIVPDIYEQALQENLLLDWSIAKLLSEDAMAEANFVNARAENINKEAERNYYAVKKDYDEKSDAVSKTEEYLAVHRERTVNMENKLETTITMNILKMNKLFEKYMDEFQFEGKIEYDRIEDKKGRVLFQLYIKVRKIGHSGRLEDVGTKARNGKLGKGVSGGEESLSSLLFALALLQNLNTSPSFIVLDEFDSALDETRKEKVFKLYETELQRKLIILSPKAHDDQYYANFSTVIVVEHDSTVPISRTKSINFKQPSIV